MVEQEAAAMGLCLEPNLDDACHMELINDERSDSERTTSVRKAAKMSRRFVDERVSVQEGAERPLETGDEPNCCSTTWEGSRFAAWLAGGDVAGG